MKLRKEPQGATGDLRTLLISKGIIAPGAREVETVNCNKCKVPFDRLKGRTDGTCGYCAHPRKEKRAA